ncbi:MAG: NAD(P)-dependent oxidoreductase [Elusimicrobia bacterium]|nr:NAD(P)-dependent oxidoreductase [Elusimicrobiota bacterium]
MNSTPRIGILGLGIMGSAMARNAARKFSVTVHNRSAGPMDVARRDGLATADSPAALAAASDIVAIIVTDPAAVRAMLLGSRGALAENGAGKILVQMSTIDEPSTMEFAREAERRGWKFLDCPVTGSKKQVTDAQLILLAGGDSDVLERCRPFLESVGKAIVHAGGVGKGTALKLCMNLIVAQMTTALCESVTLAQLQGLDPKKIFDVIGHSPALNCGYFAIKQKALLESDFSPAFSLDNMLKDVRFMTDAARRRQAPLPVTEAVRALMEAAAADGFGPDDLAGLVRALKSAPAKI